MLRPPRSTRVATASLPDRGQSAVPAVVRVGLEVGAKWVFASALDWPGWCRRGRGEHAALDTLLDYADRYAVIAGPGFAPGDLQVTGQVSGNATTDFSAPDVPGPWDTEPLGQPEADRLARLLEAGWEYLDSVVADAPAVLRKGRAAAAATAPRSWTTSARPSGRSAASAARVCCRARPGTSSARRWPERCGPAPPAGPGRPGTRCAASPGTCSTTPGR
jgi:hypothetical protein